MQISCLQGNVWSDIPVCVPIQPSTTTTTSVKTRVTPPPIPTRTANPIPRTTHTLDIDKTTTSTPTAAPHSCPAATIKSSLSGSIQWDDTSSWIEGIPPQAGDILVDQPASTTTRLRYSDSEGMSLASAFFHNTVLDISKGIMRATGTDPASCEPRRQGCNMEKLRLTGNLKVVKVISSMVLLPSSDADLMGEISVPKVVQVECHSGWEFTQGEKNSPREVCICISQIIEELIRNKLCM